MGFQSRSLSSPSRLSWLVGRTQAIFRLVLSGWIGPFRLFRVVAMLACGLGAQHERLGFADARVAFTRMRALGSVDRDTRQRHALQALAAALLTTPLA